MPRKPQTKTIEGVDGRRRVVNKNANGEGSLYHVAERRQSLDGVERVRAAHWCTTYVDPVTGKRKVVQGRTRDEAVHRREEAFAKALEARPTHTRFTPNTPVGELAAWWLDNVAVDQVRPSSLDKYRARVAHLGSVAALPLREATREGLIEWQRALLGGLSPGSVADIRTTVRQVFAHAVRSGLLPANPLDDVKPPAVHQQPGHVLTPEQVAALVAATDKHRYGTVARLLFSSGLRVSEVLGLAWSDIDLDAGLATVRRAVTYSKTTGHVLGPPKSDRALGVHRLAPSAVAALKRWRRRQSEERLRAGALWQTTNHDGSPVELVFTTQTGGLVRRQHVDTMLRRAGDTAGLDTKHLGTHVGRRTVVTTLYAAGVELADIARHVGHASTSTTAGYVAHLGDRPARTAEIAARLLDPAFEGVGPEPPTGAEW